jgi:hypothetical protein
MWISATFLHLEDNVAKWWQVYRLKHGLVTWPVFVVAIEERFGVYDYRCSIQDLLQIRQDGSVEEYTKSFQTMQFQVAMFINTINLG